MQVKIIIGTVSFMIAMMVLGYAALRETARLERFTAARTGRQIEMGAHLYDQNCASCHGIHGKAEECFDAGSGEQIGCVGLPLNYNNLLCGDISFRMEAMSWEGTKEAFLQSTIASGRPGTEMPTWSESFGGPMRADQIENLSMFLLAYETEELCSEPAFVYDWQETYEEYSVEFPDGDAAHGEELFVAPYGCSGCHGVMEDDSWAGLGPWVGDMAEVAGTRVDGLTAEEYVYESILDSGAFVVPECPAGPCTDPTAMPDNFPLRMSENPQDLQDLMSFVLGQ